MTCAEQLYDLWEERNRRTIVVAGTAKNVGKTTTVNALLRVATSRGAGVGLTSIGRDGEAFDAVDDAPKPRIFVEAGTLVAAGRALLPHARGIDVLEQRELSALGPIVFYRTNAPQYVEISGAPTASGMRSVIDRLVELGSDRVIVDGAIDRIAVIATGNDAVILATGMALAPSVAEVVRKTHDVATRIGMQRLIACTTCPIGEGRSVEAPVLVDAVGAELRIPTFDLQADLRWIP